jgi:triosephosphate isomerase
VGLGSREGLSVVFLLPEGLVVPAVRRRASFPAAERKNLAVGCQGVHWEDVQPGGNFGAFTTSAPAAAAVNLGSEWVIVGHSEERRAKLQVMYAFDPAAASEPSARARASAAVDQLVQREVQCALAAGLRVLLCVGESSDDRGEGTFEQAQPRIERVLRSQVLTGLKGAEASLRENRLVVGYEPIWAIGPGKVPPGRDYIAFVSSLIQRVVRDEFGASISVVYGGGLKEENAAMIASVETIDGGLVALTQFTGQIAFSVAQLNAIALKYLE